MERSYGREDSGRTGRGSRAATPRYIKWFWLCSVQYQKSTPRQLKRGGICNGSCSAIGILVTEGLYRIKFLNGPGWGRYIQSWTPIDDLMIMTSRIAALRNKNLDLIHTSRLPGFIMQVWKYCLSMTSYLVILYLPIHLP